MNNKPTSTPLNSLNLQTKDTQFKNELQTIFEYLNYNVCTASMLSEATGIKQKNICRYKRDLEQIGKLVEVFKTNCKATGFKAYYITTNPELIPIDKQTKLF
jgi:L-lactate utilization protein LutB